MYSPDPGIGGPLPSPSLAVSPELGATGLVQGAAAGPMGIAGGMGRPAMLLGSSMDAGTMEVPPARPTVAPHVLRAAVLAGSPRRRRDGRVAGRALRPRLIFP